MPPQLPAADAAGHLPLPLLRQYVAGTLPAAEQHRIEAHTLSCPCCADVLDGLAATDAPTTDAALAALRTRLHQRLAREAEPARGVVAWRAVAAVLLLLVLSTAAWLGLHPGSRQASQPEVAATAPAAAASRAAPAATAPLSAPIAAAPAAETMTAAAAPASARPAPTVAARSRARRPARTPAVAEPAATSADVAVVLAEAPRPAGLTEKEGLAAAPAPVAARAAAAPVAPDSSAGAAAGTVGRAEAKVVARESGAARKANLPPAVTISPQPVGGYRGLRDYLHREVNFIPEAPAKGLSGYVHLTFTVTAAGQLENFRVVRSMRADYDAEAIRLLCEGPAWQPGAANGRRADQVVEISVGF
ncbi:TonB family protein [Hymenobacter algoricola]|uniref:energy transducer TonB n=1 Tax=Hymenobacter algoricola TaxID=486267 RepID=UPI0031E74D4A